MTAIPRIRPLVAAAAVAIGTLGLAWGGGQVASAAQRPCTSADFTSFIADPDTNYHYTVPVDNPTNCTEGGPGDTFIATFIGNQWVFGQPAAPPANFAVVPPVITTCKPIIEYSVRGTLEDLDEDSTGNHPKYWGLNGLSVDKGAGVIGDAVYQQLKSAEVTGTVGVYADFYPADDLLSATNTSTLSQLYVASVDYGVTQAVKDLNQIRSDCPNSRVLIVGYSQGADVVRRTLTDSRLSTSVASPAVMVELFGDPNFAPGEENAPGSASYSASRATVLLNGAYTSPHSGLEHSFEPALIPNPPAIPTRFMVASWCHDLEPVCQGDGVSTNTHLTYGAQDGYAAGMEAASYFAGTAAPGGSVTPATAPVPVAYSMGSSCISRTPGTTQVRISFTNTGSATAVHLYRTVGYSSGMATITVAPGTTSITTVAAGGATTWTSNLPFVFGQSHFMYDVYNNDVPNPLATKPGGVPNQLLFEGFFDTLC